MDIGVQKWMKSEGQEVAKTNASLKLSNGCSFYDIGHKLDQLVETVDHLTTENILALGAGGQTPDMSEIRDALKEIVTQCLTTLEELSTGPTFEKDQALTEPISDFASQLLKVRQIALDMIIPSTSVNQDLKHINEKLLQLRKETYILSEEAKFSDDQCGAGIFRRTLEEVLHQKTDNLFDLEEECFF